jgi:hypothetical protein
MKARILSIFVIAATLIAFGCDKGQNDDDARDEAKAEEPAVQQEPAGEEKSAEEEVKQKDKSDEKLALVEVSEAGSKFDPAVQAEQIPADAWYCDMGSVHWAGMQKPDDGKCPRCGMKLKQSDPDALAAQKEGAVEARSQDDQANEGGRQQRDRQQRDRQQRDRQQGGGQYGGHGHAH